MLLIKVSQVRQGGQSDRHIRAHLKEGWQMERLDSLTRLFDEDTFYHKLDIEIKRAMRYKDDLSVLIIQPKFANLEAQTANIYPVLRVLGEIVKESVRAVDIPCRLRGELAIIFPSTPVANLRSVIDRIHRKFTDSLSSQPEDYQVTGVQYLSLGFGEDFSSLESFRRRLSDPEAKWEELAIEVAPTSEVEGSERS